MQMIMDWLTTEYPLKVKLQEHFLQTTQVRMQLRALSSSSHQSISLLQLVHLMVLNLVLSIGMPQMLMTVKMELGLIQNTDSSHKVSGRLRLLAQQRQTAQLQKQMMKHFIMVLSMSTFQRQKPLLQLL